MILKKIKLLTALGITASIISVTACSSTHQSESTGQYIDSSVITTKVKSRLLSDKIVNGLPITVKTYKSTVQLSGFVNNATQKKRAEFIARNTEGVDFVEDSLIIKHNHRL